MSFKKIKQRGQSLIMFAMLMPVLIVFTGAGIDFGWYYFNVSRLQNAADAAALAGARALIDNDENFSGYDEDAVRLVENILGDEPYEFDTTKGDEVATTYVRKNLSPDSNVEAIKRGNDYIMSDDWGVGGSSELKMTPNIYKIGGKFYYVVYLAEKVRHLFLPGVFDSMSAPVLAVAVLKKSEAVTPPRENLTLVFDANEGVFGEEETILTKLTRCEG